MINHVARAPKVKYEPAGMILTRPKYTLKGRDETPVRAPKALILILVWFDGNVVHFTYRGDLAHLKSQ